MRIPFSRRLTRDLSAHLCLSLLCALLIYLKTENSGYALVFILGGIFIDLDHLLDYFFSFRRFVLRAFLASLQLRGGKVYLLLHSWEIVFLLLTWGSAVKSPPLAILAAGFALHLVIDNLQRKNLFFYFFTYRLAHGFKVATLLPEFRFIVRS